MPYTESNLQSRFGTNAPPTIRELALQTVNLKEDTINDRYIHEKHGEIQKRLLSEGNNEHANEYTNNHHANEHNASNDANDYGSEQEEQTEQEEFLKRKNPVKLHGSKRTNNYTFTIVVISVVAMLGIAMICCGAATMKKKKI